MQLIRNLNCSSLLAGAIWENGAGVALGFKVVTEILVFFRAVTEILVFFKVVAESLVAFNVNTKVTKELLLLTIDGLEGCELLVEVFNEGFLAS